MRVFDGIAAHRAAVDEVVLRAITPTGTVEELLGFVDRAAAVLG